MNKTQFIAQLQRETQFSTEQCETIHDVLNQHFIFRKKNKIKVVEQLMQEMNFDEDEASFAYEKAMGIIRGEMKSALKRPFKTKD